jgi:cytoskeletal protein RodZ
MSGQGGDTGQGSEQRGAGKKPSAAVYRRRRLVAALLVVVVVLLVWWGVAALVGALRGGDTPVETGAQVAPTSSTDATPANPGDTATPEPTPEPTESPEPTETSTPVCTEDDVTVTAITDAESYAADALPKLSLKVVNTSDVPCIMDVGTSAQVYTIMSGSDTIWVSTHCQTGGTSQVVELTPGKEVTAPEIEWVRERSSPDTCDSDSRPAAVGGGAYYSLSVSIGGVASEPTYFDLQ